MRLPSADKAAFAAAYAYRVPLARVAPQCATTRSYFRAMRISLDEEQVFYVQSRGFARGSAERMIALAFFEPAIAGFPTELLRDEVRTALDERLDDIGETFVS